MTLKLRVDPPSFLREGVNQGVVHPLMAGIGHPLSQAECGKIRTRRDLMKYAIPAWVIFLVAVPGAVRAQDAGPEAGGKVFHSRCMGCHFIPDSSLRRDRIWIGMIQTTA